VVLEEPQIETELVERAARFGRANHLLVVVRVDFRNRENSDVPLVLVLGAVLAVVHPMKQIYLSIRRVHVLNLARKLAVAVDLVDIVDIVVVVVVVVVVDLVVDDDDNVVAYYYSSSSKVVLVASQRLEMECFLDLSVKHSDRARIYTIHHENICLA
jgi:hypothetical protein